VPVATSGFSGRHENTISFGTILKEVSPKLSVPIAPKYAVLFGTYYSIK
jgi:hypothetical protein